MAPFAVLPLCTTLQVAGSALAQPPLGYYDYVSKVVIKDDNRVWINVAGNFDQRHGCDNTAFGVSSTSLASDSGKAFLQLALASLLSRTKVYVEVSGCSEATHGPSWSGSPVVHYLQLYRED
jgi:hypothetical protein